MGQAPNIGRFISEDPARDDLNWYVYCGSNPINFLDPLGLDSKVSTEHIAESYGFDFKVNDDGSVSVTEYFANGGSLTATYSSSTYDTVFGMYLIDTDNFADKFGLNDYDVKSQDGFIVTDGSYNEEMLDYLEEKYNPNGDRESGVTAHSIEGKNSNYAYISRVVYGDKYNISENTFFKNYSNSPYYSYRKDYIAAYHAHIYHEVNFPSCYYPSGADYGVAFGIHRIKGFTVAVLVPNYAVYRIVGDGSLGEQRYRDMEYIDDTDAYVIIRGGK